MRHEAVWEERQMEKKADRESGKVEEVLHLEKS